MTPLELLEQMGKEAIAAGWEKVETESDLCIESPTGRRVYYNIDEAGCIHSSYVDPKAPL